MHFPRHHQTLYLCLSVVLLIVALPAFAQSADQEVPCGERPECYERTPTPSPPRPPMTLEPISGIVHQPTIWEGLIDGRLNPDMTEYYSVWCENNLVRVLRSSPSPETVAEFPLAEINRLGAGISPLMVNGVIATRISDTIYLSGSNGNLAPLPGSKSFSLPACNERSGGAPPAPPDTPADGAQPAAPTEIDLSQCENQTFVDQNPVLCGDSANPDSGISIMWRLISGACYFYGIVPAAFSMVFVFRGSRKRDERLRDKAERDTERQ